MAARSTPAGDTDYETSSGAGYETLRRADSRIAAQIRDALGDAHTVLNVGAGAGSYEPDDRIVVAVEPSAAMRARRPAGSVPAVDAAAESLPFDDGAFDAAMAIFTVHQWRDRDAGLRELRRVTRGPVVLMTIEPGGLDGFWLGDYLPERLATEQARFGPSSAVRAALGGTTRVEPVPIPLDCTDGFVEAYYGRPEALLDPQVRAAQSAWQFVDEAVAEAGLARLADDLASGAWDERWGHLRRQPTFVGPLVLVVAPR